MGLIFAKALFSLHGHRREETSHRRIRRQKKNKEGKIIIRFHFLVGGASKI